MITRSTPWLGWRLGLAVAVFVVPLIATLFVRGAPLPAVPSTLVLSVFEGITSLIALAIAYIGLRSFVAHGSVRLLTLGLGFGVFGVFDFGFGVTAAPLDATRTTLALWYWVIGRLLGAALLVASVLLPELPRAKAAPRPRGELRALLGGIAATTLALLLVGWWATDEFPPLLTDAYGLAPEVIVVEWLAVVAEAWVAVAYLRRYAHTGHAVLLAFAYGLGALAAADVAFSAYRALFDDAFWFGYGYKLCAYALLAYGFGRLVRHPPR